MKNDDSAKDCADWKMHKKWHHKKETGGLYGLAFLGAAVYYIQSAPTFWWGVLGVLKAMIWPAILLYHVFLMLKF